MKFLSNKYKITLFCFVCFNFYLFLKIIFSHAGLLSYFELKKEVKQNTEILASVKDENRITSYKLSLLNPNYISRDYLFELGKKEFGYVKENEYLVVAFDKKE